MLAQPGQQIVLDAAAAKVVEKLVRLDVFAAWHGPQLLHVGEVEIAHAEVANLAGVAQRLERFDRLGQWYAAAPMQQIKVDAIGAQALEAALAGSHGTFARGIVRIDFGNQKRPIALTGERLADQRLRQSLAVHLGGIDKSHAQVEAEPDRCDLLDTTRPVFAVAPSAQSQCRNGFAGSKSDLFHPPLLIALGDGQQRAFPWQAKMRFLTPSSPAPLAVEGEVRSTAGTREH